MTALIAGSVCLSCCMIQPCLFSSLQTLCLDGNLLTSLPDELGNLQQLTSLGISFNSFSQIPEVLEKLTMLDKVVMAGNRLEILNLGVLTRMSHVKHVDLRMNNLKTVIIENLEGNKHITHMDLRDNQLTDLDLSSLCNLEQLHCERNQLRELTLSGFSLRTLYASWNSEFSIQPPVLALSALVCAF